MELKILNIGSFKVNNYILFDEESKDIVLIDAGGDLEATKAAIEKLGGNLKYLLNTHGHMDHIAGDYDIQNYYNIPVYLHKDDENLVHEMKQYLQYVGMPDYEEPQNVTFIEDGHIFQIGEHIIKTIHTPGHTRGGVSYLIGDMLFSGDTLFFESIGRTDLPGGSYEELVKSIKTKLFTLPENIIVYPGHGESSTIGHEKNNNQYV